jgi:hypothetical protein
MSCDKKWSTLFIPPAFATETYRYQNINKDPKLREQVTLFYYEKIIKWIQKYKEFSKYKSLLPYLKTKKGYIYVYKLLRTFVKMHKTNWYDLRKKYEVLKDYLQYKLSPVTH